MTIEEKVKVFLESLQFILRETWICTPDFIEMYQIVRFTQTHKCETHGETTGKVRGSSKPVGSTLQISWHSIWTKVLGRLSTRQTQLNIPSRCSWDWWQYLSWLLVVTWASLWCTAVRTSECQSEPWKVVTVNRTKRNADRLNCTST